MRICVHVTQLDPQVVLQLLADAPGPGKPCTNFEGKVGGGGGYTMRRERLSTGVTNEIRADSHEGGL